jgi:hypothetical protein
MSKARWDLVEQRAALHREMPYRPRTPHDIERAMRILQEQRRLTDEIERMDTGRNVVAWADPILASRISKNGLVRKVV